MLRGSSSTAGAVTCISVSEATRQYQATLEARRAAWDGANADEADEMDEEVAAAKRAMEVAWLIAST